DPPAGRALVRRLDAVADRGEEVVGDRVHGAPGPEVGDAGYGRAPTRRGRTRGAPLVGQLRRPPPGAAQPRVLVDLLDLGGVLADEAGRVGEVGEGVVPRTVTAGPPLWLDAVHLEIADAPHEVVDARQLVGDVVDRGPCGLVEGDDVVLRGAAEEGHLPLGPVGDAHPEDLRVELRG